MDTTYIPPLLTDIIESLPRKPLDPNYVLRSEAEMAQVDVLAVHYDAEPVHGAYDPVQRYIAQARFHIGKNWNTQGGVAYGFGLMYHYRISPDGRLWRTQPEALITWNAMNANRRDLAICLDLGSGQQPTPEQLDTLQRFCDWICLHRPDLPGISQPSVWGHGELVRYGNDTTCPGATRPYVQRYRATGYVLEGQQPNPAPAPEPAPDPATGALYCPQTKQYINNGFKALFLKLAEEHGGNAVELTGYPLTGEYTARLDTPEGPVDYTLQDFENLVFEWRSGQEPRISAGIRRLKYGY